jgi:glutamyl-tRNA reductase
MDELNNRVAVDAVKEYRAMAEQVRDRELQRAQRALARGEDPLQLLVQMSRALTNKLIHAPTTGLKQASAEGRQDLINNARRLLGLDVESPRATAVETDEEADGELPAPTVETTRRTLQ